MNTISGSGEQFHATCVYITWHLERSYSISWGYRLQCNLVYPPSIFCELNATSSPVRSGETTRTWYDSIIFGSGIDPGTPKRVAIIIHSQHILIVYICDIFLLFPLTLVNSSEYMLFLGFEFGYLQKTGWLSGTQSVSQAHSHQSLPQRQVPSSPFQ
jgi:hypothetical protein